MCRRSAARCPPASTPTGSPCPRSALATGLPALLEIVAEVVTEATFPKSEVSGERDRLVQELSMYRSQPSVLAREALLRRLYGKHPYGTRSADRRSMADTARGDLRAPYTERVSPAGATLILVGDLQPAQTLDLVARTLARWSGKKSAAAAETAEAPARTPAARRPSRCGADQHPPRRSGAVADRSAVRRAATRQHRVRRLLHLTAGQQHPRGQGIHVLTAQWCRASGGRLTAHDRRGCRDRSDRSGDARGVVRARPDQPVAGRRAELDAARSYASGTLALSTATAAGLASTLSMLAGAGVGPEYLKEHPAALAKVTPEDVLEVASSCSRPRIWLPCCSVTPARSVGPVEALGEVSLTDKS